MAGRNTTRTLLLLGVCFVVLLSSAFFVRFSADKKAATPENDISNDQVSADKDVGEEGSGSAILKIEHEPSLNPESANTFVVSMFVKFDSFPAVGVRHFLAEKYTKHPWRDNGWAIAIKQHATSLRPQVYWNGNSEKGGWYAFGDYRFKQNVWYSLSLVAKTASYVSLYVQEIGENLSENGKSRKQVEFLGSADTSQAGLPSSVGPLLVGLHRSQGKEFDGSIEEFSILQIPATKMKSREAIQDLLDGGPKFLVQKADRNWLKFN